MLPVKNICIVIIVFMSLCCSAGADDPIVRLGIIGLDTSHVVHFTKYINEPQNKTGCQIIAAYPGGSPDIPDSADRLEIFTQTLRDEFGIEIVESIETLCRKVDGVLLESVDGRPHLEQVKPVFAAGKPVFIDKPVAGNLTDAIEIFRLAKKHKVPCWSSSSLRFSPGIIGMRNDTEIGKVLGCVSYGPCPVEPHHPDMYWYGIHGIEMLFIIMGPGCESVSRTHTDDIDLVVGKWKDGRIGTYRGMRKGHDPFGALVFGQRRIGPSGPYVGYEPLVKEIVKFFHTGEPPVAAEETIEIFAFMSAADISKERAGAVVSLDEVMKAESPFRSGTPVLTVDSLGAGQTTSLSLDQALPINLSYLQSITLTAECTYSARAEKGIRLHIRASYDGYKYNASDLFTLEHDFESGQICRKDFNINTKARFIKVLVENPDKFESVSSLQITATAE